VSNAEWIVYISTGVNLSIRARFIAPAFALQDFPRPLGVRCIFTGFFRSVARQLGTTIRRAHGCARSAASSTDVLLRTKPFVKYTGVFW
jgi:hypothetical protein